MNKIKENKLKQIRGGFGFWGIAGIISACVFISGVLDGIVHPKKCNN